MSTVDESPVPDTGRSLVYSFPYRNGADEIEVRATLRVRWEEDPQWGVGTVWWADFSRPPWRLDGELDGLVGLDEVQRHVAEQHRTSPAADTLGPSPLPDTAGEGGRREHPG